MENSNNPKRVHLPTDDPRLAKFKLFAGLSTEELKALLDLSDTVEHQSGDIIVNSGDAGYCMYVILKGSVAVSMAQGTQTVELAQLEGGDFFGEIALVDDGPRSATVTCVQGCELLRITRMTIGVLAGLQPGAAIQILVAIGRALVNRLRIGNQKYVDILLQQNKPS